MKLKKPIIIVGVGRSGSSTFHSLLSQHTDVSWLSVFLEKYPDKLWLNRWFMEMIDIPLLSHAIKRRFRPREAYEFWEYYCKGFTVPCRDLVADDLTEKVRSRINEVFPRIVSRKRTRLLIKLTGWPRISFLRKVFCDAKFIHIIRDGRSVVNSMINVPWWWGWRGPSNWRWGELTPEQNAEWEAHDKSFVALAAIQWNILMDAYDIAKTTILEENYLEIRYEDLCDTPDQVFKEVLQFCDLDHDEDLIKSVQRHPLENKNYKWKEELAEHQREMITDICYNYLRKYKYLS